MLFVVHKGQDNRTNIPKRDTNGSDQSSHSTLKPLHQPISRSPPHNKHSRAKERGGDEARRGLLFIHVFTPLII